MVGLMPKEGFNLRFQVVCCPVVKILEAANVVEEVSLRNRERAHVERNTKILYLLIFL